jgi:Heparinase II/III-like protein/Heparinase II/III N-terminus
VTLAREVLWRTQRHWRQKNLREKLAKSRCPVVVRAAGYYEPKLEQLPDKEREIVLRYADAICAGEFPWFGYGPVSLGFPPRWNLDFVSGGTWPEIPAAAIRVVRHDGSDVKVPWELSRLQFLPVLGKAWRLTGENRYREAGKDLLTNWVKKNPAGVGINWSIAMEAALRGISICLFLDLLAPFTEEESTWIPGITHCLWQHFLFIEAHNEFSHLTRSNHYLSNIVGLFCLATFLHGPGMESRRQHYQGLIEREILQQVYSDGGNYEASTGYHVLCTEMFTHALLLMRSQRTEPTSEFALRLQLMYRFLAALVDGRGEIPQLGDCDDGRIELLSDDLEKMFETTDNRFSLTVSGLLGIGEYLYGEDYGGCKTETLWYGQVSNSRHALSPNALRKRPIVFPNSGLAIARKDDLEVVFVAMPNGIGGKGSHTHNDKLSLVVSVGEQPLFVDSGTGCYTRDAELRNQFRSTSAHNTIQIDGAEQNGFSRAVSELFRLNCDANVSQIEVQEENGISTLRASHDGYKRFGVKHTRRVRLTAQSSVIVEDSLTGSGDHCFEAFFHLPVPRKVTIEQNRGKEVACQITLGARIVHMSCRAAVELQLACAAAKISTAYGLVRQSTVITINGKFHSSLVLLSHISLGVRNG